MTATLVPRSVFPFSRLGNRRLPVRLRLGGRFNGLLGHCSSSSWLAGPVPAYSIKDTAFASHSGVLCAIRRLGRAWRGRRARSARPSCATWAAGRPGGRSRTWPSAGASPERPPRPGRDRAQQASGSLGEQQRRVRSRHPHEPVASCGRDGLRPGLRQRLVRPGEGDPVDDDEPARAAGTSTPATVRSCRTGRRRRRRRTCARGWGSGRLPGSRPAGRPLPDVLAGRLQPPSWT